MQGLGEKLRQRARELGLTDTEVARRLGLSQARYANYVADKREPDFRTFLDICRILATSPDHLLGGGAALPVPGLGESPPPFEGEGEPAGAAERTLLRDRILAAAAAMSLPALRAAATVMDALARLRADE